MEISEGTWTRITSDKRLVRHLFDLYFCWEYPTLASLSREHFLQDFNEGCPRFCSSLLVNALLALGARFSDLPSTRADPDDPHTAGDNFFKEAEELLWKSQDQHCLTTVQALGIMSIREASCGRDSQSRYYAGQSIRLTIEMGLHKITDTDGRDEDELRVRLATFWGSFALDHAWSLTTGSLPLFSSSPILPAKPAVIGRLENALWKPYTDEGTAAHDSSSDQPSHIGAVYNCCCELSEIIHKSLYMLYCPTKTVTSQEVNSIYKDYFHWYNNVPDVLRLGHNFTPQVLFVHMYYHYAILLIFRPLIKLRLVGSAVLPRTLCAEAANAIQALMGSYSRLYSLRRTPSFVPYFVLQASRTLFAIEESSSVDPQATIGSSKPWRKLYLDHHRAEAFNCNMDRLKEMAPCHRVAMRALELLQCLLKAWNIYAEVQSSLEIGQRHQQYDPHWLALPVANGHGLFTNGPTGQKPSRTQSTTSQSESGGAAEASTTPQEEAIVLPSEDELKKALFWPAPRPSWPLVPTGSQLKEAGFEVLS